MTTDKLTDAISARIEDAPALHELDDGETIKLKIKYIKSAMRDTEGVGMSFFFGNGSSETIETVADCVEPLLDKRKFKISDDQPKYKQNKTWEVGIVEIDKSGSIVDYELNTDYLKPTEV